MATEMPTRDWTGVRERCSMHPKRKVKPGRLLCATCCKAIDRIRAEFYGVETKQVFVTGGRSEKKKPKKSEPTCCYVGCYEPRNPGEPYCHIHENEEVEE